MTAREDAVESAMKADSLSQAAIAVPLFGTTLSHYAVLCDEWGFEELKSWHRSLRDRGIREARGNGAVKDLVAEGACLFGFTDSDDVFIAMDQGKPVKMLPVRLKSGKTICLPNSVAKIRGCLNPELADKFIRYLISEEVEIMLANSASRQIPLGPVNETLLPADLQPLLKWAADGVSLDGAAQHDQEVLRWLSQEYSGK
jgi:iron(III) transport system substrate-binding protein